MTIPKKNDDQSGVSPRRRADDGLSLDNKTRHSELLTARERKSTAAQLDNSATRQTAIRIQLSALSNPRSENQQTSVSIRNINSNQQPATRLSTKTQTNKIITLSRQAIRRN